MDEQEWRINCFGMETGKTMVKVSWINKKYPFVFAKGYLYLSYIQVCIKYGSWRYLLYDKLRLIEPLNYFETHY